MTNCPCCSNKMLRHFRLHETYWFCRQCWQEMPNLILEKHQHIASSFNLTDTLPVIKQAINVQSVAAFCPL